jgi:predicted secreted protein
MVNRLILYSFIYKEKIKFYDRFIREVRVIQYIRYNKYGYIIKGYKNQVTCGRYAETHSIKDYEKPNTFYKYVLYQGNYNV